jgi:transcription elongation factor
LTYLSYIQFTVLCAQTRFFSPANTLTLRSRNKDQNWVGGQDENRVYIGKDVVVGPSEYKGCRGIIKDIRIDGTAEIELDNQTRRHATIHLGQLLLL